MTVDEWKRKFEDTYKTLPPLGYILKTQDDSPVRVYTKCEPGQDYVMYSVAEVPRLVGVDPKWVITNDNRFGVKCVLLPIARERSFRKYGLNDFSVKSLRVVKHALSGKALMVEIAEW